MQNKKILALMLTLFVSISSIPTVAYATTSPSNDVTQIGNATNTDDSQEASEDDTSNSTSKSDDASDNTTSDSNTSSDTSNTTDENTSLSPDASSSTMITEEVLAPESVTIPDIDLEPGTYYISSSKANRQVLDVSAGSLQNYGNVQLYTTNMSGAQKWNLSFDKDGYATFTNVNSGKALDVSGAIAQNGQNVQQYTSNNTKAQKWVISKSSNGYIISSALSDAYNSKPITASTDISETEPIVASINTEPDNDLPNVPEPIPTPPDYVLDCTYGSTSNYTNMQIYTANGSSAQCFTFTKTNIEPVTGSQILEDGVYTIGSQLSDNEKCLDIANGSASCGANVQLFSKNNTLAQKFHFKYDDSTGCYIITNIASGLVLDADCGNPINGTNVHMWFYNGGNNQKWALYQNSDTYTLINRANANALNISDRININCANIETYTSNGSSAQNFYLEQTELIQDGVYTISTLLNPSQTLDVPCSSATAGVQMQLYQKNSSLAQKFVLHQIEPNTYTIAAVASAKYLTAESGKVVQQNNKNSDTQKWILMSDGNGIILKNKATDTVMDCKNGCSSNGTPLQLYTSNGTQAQRFQFSTTPLLNNGLYEIASAIDNNKRIDVANGSISSGANIHLWDDNGSNAQKFNFTSIGNNIYQITNVKSGNVIDVSCGSTLDGANVQQWVSNGSDAQKWKVSITDDGWYTFTNVGSGKCLDVTNGSSSNGSNIQIYSSNNSPSQQWRLIPTTKKIEDPVLARAQAIASIKSSKTNYLITVDLSAHRVVIFTGWQGHWIPIQNWICTNGAPSTPTVVGDFTIGSRGYSFGSGYTCYYYTQFYGNYLFHSVLYKQGTRIIKDGRLGYALSHGCVRLDINNAKWIYDNIPSQTKVVTYK